MNLTNLIQAAKNGSKAAFNCLFSENVRYLTAVASRSMSQQVRNKVSATSLVNETYLCASQCIHQFRGNTPEELRGWLCRIAIRKVANLPRRPEIRQPMSSLPMDVEDLQSNPAESLLERESRDKFLAAYRRLAPAERMLIDLVHQGKLTWQQIGQKFNVSADTARKRWAALQVRLGKEIEDSQ